MHESGSVLAPKTSSRLWMILYRRLKTPAKVVETLGKFAIVVTVIQWLLEAPQRNNAAIFQAWQVINSAAGQAGSSGRVQALDELAQKHVDLEDLIIRGAVLKGLRLPRARLPFADFRDSKISNSDFHQADIVRGNFSHSELREDRFDGASLDRTDFSHSSFSKTSFVTVYGSFWREGAEQRSSGHTDTSLEGARFTHAQLWDCAFESAFLAGTDFARAQVLVTKFIDSRMDSANFSHAEISGSHFEGSNLYRTSFRGAALTCVSFRGASLREVDFTGARLDGVDFTDAKEFDKATLRHATVVHAVPPHKASISIGPCM